MTTAVPAAPAVTKPNPAIAAEAKREERSRGSLRGFALIFLQVLIFVVIAWRFRQAFLPLAGVVAVAFAVHYWTPYRFKEACWFAITLAGGTFLTARGGPTSTAFIVIGLVLAAAAVIHLIVASPLPYYARLALVVAFFASFFVVGGGPTPLWHAPQGFYFVFASLFALRIVPYLHEAKYAKERASLRDFYRYFFMLPGFKLATPIADPLKVKQSFYARPTDEIAQQGIYWIARGTIQFAVFLALENGLVYVTSPSEHPLSPRALVFHLACAYGQYLRTSSRLHMYLGIMHLFGYDLPECYRWFGMAHSPLDFWRKANIYWKDAMTKIVYFPVYFALRKKNDTAAKLIALMPVFVVSMVLHLWQDIWFRDLKTPIWTLLKEKRPDEFFWMVFMVLCLVNLALEIRAEKQPKAPVQRLPPKAAPLPGFAGLVAKGRAYVVERLGIPRGMSAARAAAQILALQTTVAVLFSLRHAPSFRAFYYTVAFWR
jgi:hypothetical protein